METLISVFMTNQDVYCHSSFDIRNSSDLVSDDVFEDYCELYAIYVPNSHEIYLDSDAGHECFAICETFGELRAKLNELAVLFEQGQYKFASEDF